MDLHSQLKNLFPEHKYSEIKSNVIQNRSDFSYDQITPLLCKYEKRKGKPITIIDGFEKLDKIEIKKIARSIKQKFSVGGSVKNKSIIIQGNFRDEIMKHLSVIGFKVKRVGG